MIRRPPRSTRTDTLFPYTTSSDLQGQVRVEFRLWDVFAEQYMTGTTLTVIPESLRRAAHIIADLIYKRITGEDGYFDSRIVYIAESGAQNRRKKQLAIMDQDGANHKFLTDGGTLVLTPRFSPTHQEITYLAYYNNKPRSEDRRVGNECVSTCRSRWSPYVY